MKNQNDANQSNAEGDSKQEGDVATAKLAFEKLPILGPIVWLYARTQDRRFLFLADLDWAVLPPVVLDQCRLFMREKMPYAFVTWAYVNDEIHERLTQGNPKIAPHEWASGKNLWLIDVVTPFGGMQDILADVQRMNFPGRPLRYLNRDPQTQRNEVYVYPESNPGTGRPSLNENSIH